MRRPCKFSWAAGNLSLRRFGQRYVLLLFFLVLLLCQGGGAPTRFEVRYDLIDAGVYVCTPKVQELFAVSFDYMSIKNDFIPDLITKEIKLEAVYTHVLEVRRSPISNVHFPSLSIDTHVAFVATTMIGWLCFSSG